jgi:hypothetical protein
MFHHFRNGVTLFDLETANQTTRIDNSSRVRLKAFGAYCQSYQVKLMILKIN